eukprot:CAMPEP_0177795276 /NCGR_PEP_ID=MMETSP0491_2-20121128/26138_1 /TAXON_ID=63592 /ORGANISM="Tetraselmis chuii, Strain PLY429" /LENGTH=33 /DNA_ID= /DNA_START= /DNA_END= /DNA_ORIENTATION=
MSAEPLLRGLLCFSAAIGLCRMLPEGVSLPAGL